MVCRFALSCSPAPERLRGEGHMSQTVSGTPITIFVILLLNLGHWRTLLTLVVFFKALNVFMDN